MATTLNAVSTARHDALKKSHNKRNRAHVGLSARQRNLDHPRTGLKQPCGSAHYFTLLSRAAGPGCGRIHHFASLPWGTDVTRKAAGHGAKVAHGRAERDAQSTQQNV